MWNSKIIKKEDVVRSSPCITRFSYVSVIHIFYFIYETLESLEYEIQFHVACNITRIPHYIISKLLNKLRMVKVLFACACLSIKHFINILTKLAIYVGWIEFINWLDSHLNRVPMDFKRFFTYLNFAFSEKVYQLIFFSFWIVWLKIQKYESKTN